MTSHLNLYALPSHPRKWPEGSDGEVISRRSFRGGYGHGLAADIVSVSGDTDGQRWMASDKLWNWIDVHPEFGIGRPYLGKDPPHVGPIDGKEYADHRKSNVAKRLLAK
jgi:hypothetical protein